MLHKDPSEQTKQQNMMSQFILSRFLSTFFSTPSVDADTTPPPPPRTRTAPPFFVMLLQVSVKRTQNIVYSNGAHKLIAQRLEQQLFSNAYHYLIAICMLLVCSYLAFCSNDWCTFSDNFFAFVFTLEIHYHTLGTVFIFLLHL